MKRGIVSLAFFSIAAVLGRFQTIRGTTPFWEIFPAVAVALAAMIVSFWSLNLLLKNDNKALAITILAFFFFFFFGELLTFAYSHLQDFTPRRWTALILLGIVLTAVSLIMTLRKEFPKLGQFFHVIARVMGISSMVFFIMPIGFEPKLEARGPRVLQPIPTNTQEKPDVYFLLFDAYTSIASLKSHWNFEDAVFLNFLDTNGFKIITNGQANYVSTPFCLSSILNMDYVTIDHRNPMHSDVVNFLWKDIASSEVPFTFQQLGYEIYNLSFFQILDFPPAYKSPDIKYSSLQGIILANSPIGYYIEGKQKWAIGDVNLTLVQRVKEAAHKTAKPKFVYAHFMMPHQPYIFAHDGSRLPLGLEQNTRKKEFYLEQVQFANTKIQEIVREILTHSKTRPIIVIMGDHGFRFIEGPQKESEAQSALLALLIPEGKQLPQDLTGVNVFRHVFAEGFNLKIKLLPNKQFFSPQNFE